LLDADQFKRAGRVTILFEAKGDHLAYTLHKRIETLCLRMAATKARDRGDEITFLIALDHDGEFPLRFHADTSV
jgi:hypothetical protein